MGTSIEWTDETWNPVTGCTKVSPGCDHCYAERVTERWSGKGSFAEVKLHPERLDKPLHWRRPRRIFVNSMSDLFHEQVPEVFIAGVFAVMARAPQHTFQVLTKRHGRMRSLLNSDDFQARVLAHDVGQWPLPNVHLIVSVENQHWAGIRIPALRQTPAAVRGLSCEPLLGPIDLAHMPAYDAVDEVHWAWNAMDGIDWVIVGGESGPGARPMHPDWARSLRDQCVDVGVPFLFKQWGEHVVEDQSPMDIVLPGQCTYLLGDAGPCFYRVGKKAAGRELDGRTWDQYPEARAPAMT